MFVKHFAEDVARMAQEVACDGKGNIGAHHLPSRVTIMCDDPNDDNEYELVAIEPSLVIGCGCWDGIDIHIKRKTGS